jgi:hypothetical protein
VLDDELDDELDEPPPELDDEPLEVLLALEDELLEGELDELLEGALDELDDDVPPPVDEPPVPLDDDPSGEVGSVVQPVSPAAITATGAPDSSSRKSRRRFSAARSERLVAAVLRSRVGMAVLH